MSLVSKRKRHEGAFICFLHPASPIMLAQVAREWPHGCRVAFGHVLKGVVTGSLESGFSIIWLM